MILAIPEYTAHPVAPEQWDRYYNTLLDKIYIQTLTTPDPMYPNWVEMSTGAAVREDMREIVSLTRSQYSARDFQSYMDEIIAYIAHNWGDDFNDFMASDPAIMIVEYISAALGEMSWYLDRESTEWYIQLGRIKSNAVLLARMLGYKPSQGVAASVDIQVTLSSGPYAFDVTLKKGHQFQGPNGLIFELPIDQVIPSGDTVKTVGAFQGKSYRERFVSSGLQDQIFSLSLVPKDQIVAYGKTYLTVDGVAWTEVDFLPYEATQVYELNALNKPPQIRFGNDILGKIPEQGKEIVVDYVATSGEKAAFASRESIKTSLTTVVANFQTIPITVTNLAPATGGAPEESLEKIKANAPRFFMTADRLVTKTDYETLAGRFTSISGAVAKASADIIRGVDQDLELQELMGNISEERENLSTYVDAIKTNQQDIKNLTGSVGVAGSIRDLVDDAKLANSGIIGKTDLIDTLVATVKGNISDIKNHIADAQIRLDYIPYQEMIAMGDGTTNGFSKTLSHSPIKEGSVTVLVADKTESKTNVSTPDGDCDTTPGRVSSASITFVSGDAGNLIRIGGEYRQISKYWSAHVVEYSGPRIYGTSLIVSVYPPAIVGYDNGAGAFSAPLSGTIVYSSGVISGLTFMTVPDGISGKYGVPIMCTYQYKATAIQSVLTSADDDANTASTNTDGFSTYGDDIDALAGENDDYLDDINTGCTSIDAEANSTIGFANLADNVPSEIQNDIDVLSEYIDTMFSGNCKANIVRISCLAKDGNGFYAAPSIALIQDLKTYLDGLKIRCVQNSVVSGDFYVVEVKMSVVIGVGEQYTFKQVSEGVLAALDTMFKDREYGERGHLKRSEYYGVIDAVAGVTYSNNEITDTRYQNSDNTETAPLPDTDGNLFIADHEVISKWEVIVTQASRS